MAEEQPPAEHHLTHPKMTEEGHIKKGGMISAYRLRYSRRGFCTFLTILLLLIAITTLILWLIYRPYKPQFTVVSAAIYDLNTTSPPFISTTMQFTVLARNPNRRVSIYYDNIYTYVSYKNQVITPQVMLPPLFQEKHSTVVLSLVIGGTPVPVALDVANGLMMDEKYGVVSLRLGLLGKLRWKAGAIRTGHNEFSVTCSVLMGLTKGFVGQLPLLGDPECKVDI
ncbi:NDR1/HIN1-like protein 12 [Quillaja saponaria]|uniref:NDR1/HIN1-like protein 12 n=1 Tax=Quillaja saponaria TaxID=32244 RepID=A0AAD7L4V6_QUISA|nr:NDR1/HIN1-like protein 12 [Quillaja saponaria]